MGMALIAMVFYALEITITDLKLGTVPPRLTTFFYASGVALFSLLSIILNKESIQIVNSDIALFMLAMIFVSFVAASAHFYALNQGIGTANLTLVYAFLPVAGAIYLALIKKEVPSLNLVLAIFFAGLSIYLVSTTQKIK